jgi:WXXGXW repeat (2 copies)
MYKKRWDVHLIMGVLVASVLLASVTPAHARVYVSIAPPPVQIEVAGPPPSPRHVWIGGYQRWDGTAYVWAPGHWVVRPSPRAVWVPGHWQHHWRGWYWVEGHWS